MSVNAKGESLDSTDADQTQDEHAVKKPTKAQRRKVIAVTFLFSLLPYMANLSKSGNYTSVLFILTFVGVALFSGVTPGLSVCPKEVLLEKDCKVIVFMCVFLYIYIIIIRLHRPYYVRRCGLLLPTE